MHEEIEKVLDTVRYATISTVDKNGQPWAAPVWYVYDKEKILYWWSSTASQHSINIKNNPNVYITIFDSNVKEGDGFGLYIRADACVISEDELESVSELYNTSTSVFKLDISDSRGDAPTRFYKAVPKEMWVNRGKEVGEFYEDYREKL